ncbi:MAG: hypothetical protein IH624_19440 [Phycisphaerae bacterium]|nr:hypothetical protein [Phycisphaerae bacterium]
MRYVLFCVFFTIGAGAIALSILVEPEISNYYQNRVHLGLIEEGNERIRRLTAAYEAQIVQLRQNPDLLVKLQTITFGRQPAGDGVALPKASDEHLTAAKEALLEELDKQTQQPLIPEWVHRCAEPQNRRVIFTAGAALLLTTFIFFGTTPRRRPQTILPTP